jgi:hypothetical protein
LAAHGFRALFALKFHARGLTIEVTKVQDCESDADNDAESAERGGHQKSHNKAHKPNNDGRKCGSTQQTRQCIWREIIEHV